MTLMWGIGIRIFKGNVQEAINLGGALFRQGYGRPPTHVALPPDCDPSTVPVHADAGARLRAG